MDSEFLLLRRELQQRLPIPHIYAHIDNLLCSISPESFQSSFLKHVASYQIDASLLKKLASFLLARFDRIYRGEKYALEDEFVEYLAGRLIEPAGDGKCDRFYDLQSVPLSLHIRASESLISEGTTGYSLWEASVALLALLCCESNRFDDCFKGKRVLELGSGTGLGGLSIAALANPNRVLLTDIAQVHDSYTRPNLLLNSPSISCADSAILHWNDLIAVDSNYATEFDTIVGCDIVYDPEICSLLIKVFSSLLFRNSSTIKTIFLVCTLRNPETFSAFVEDLKGIPGVTVEVSTINADALGDEIILKSVESFRIIKLIQ